MKCHKLIHCIRSFINFFQLSQFFCLDKHKENSSPPVYINLFPHHSNQPFDVFTIISTQTEISMWFDVNNNLYCNIRYDGWLDSCTPLKIKKIKMTKMDLFLKASLACDHQRNTIKWEENNVLFNLCPDVKAHRNTDGLKCWQTSWN